MSIHVCVSNTDVYDWSERHEAALPAAPLSTSIPSPDSLPQPDRLMAMDNITVPSAAKFVRPDILSGIQHFIAGSSYRDVIESSAQYNTGIVSERRARQPYLDTLTGVAQSDCFLWMQRADRMPGQSHGQLYSYPAKRWKKKRRQYLMNETFYSNRRNRDAESAVPEHESQSVAAEQVAIKTDSNPEPAEKLFDNSKDGWYAEYDDGSDLPDAGELDDPESDYDDYEEYSSRKKKKRKETPKRKRIEYSDAEKPFACELCGARYKTRPGLSYHYTHSHQNEGGPDGRRLDDADPDVAYTPPRLQSHQQSATVTNGQAAAHASQPQPPASPSQPYSQPSVVSSLLSGTRASPISSLTPAAGAGPPASQVPPEGSEFGGNRPKGKGSVASPSNYCDFCLGDSVENKKTKSAESLVSCSDCGRSAHPSCLQFTPNMIESVKKYRWQCIECKSCGLCGTSENDVSCSGSFCGCAGRSNLFVVSFCNIFLFAGPAVVLRRLRSGLPHVLLEAASFRTTRRELVSINHLKLVNKH
jgi:zinc finger protein ubi-d4